MIELGSLWRDPDVTEPACSVSDLVCLGLAPSGSCAGDIHGSTPSPVRAFSRVAYCTKVGMHWPRVVRTARTPDLGGVHPTLFQ